VSFVALAARFHLREQLAAAASVLDEDYATSNLLTPRGRCKIVAVEISSQSV
jgi:hypothetical protein